MYPHPADNSRPLFFVVDTVHLLKCIRNNWLNQKNEGCSIFYPEFSSTTSQVQVKKATFETLRELYASEQHNLSKLGYGLSYKALKPSNIERRNVKLALKVISPFIAEALKTYGAKLGLSCARETAEFIELIHKWWCVVNTKTPSKGKHLRNPLQAPVKSMEDMQLQFLNAFVDWLDTWEKLEDWPWPCRTVNHGDALGATSHVVLLD